MISGSDLYMYLHFLIMRVKLQVFSSNTVSSCKSNKLHWEVVLSQSEHKAIQVLLSSDDVHNCTHNEPFGYLSLHTGGSPLYLRFLWLSSCFSVIPYCSKFFSKFPRACTITLVVFFTAKLEIEVLQIKLLP